MTTTTTAVLASVWSCCKAQPAGVIRYADGTGVVACRPCLATVGQDRRSPLPLAHRYGRTDYAAAYAATLAALGRTA